MKRKPKKKIKEEKVAQVFEALSDEALRRWAENDERMQGLIGLYGFDVIADRMRALIKEGSLQIEMTHIS